MWQTEEVRDEEREQATQPRMDSVNHAVTAPRPKETTLSERVGQTAHFLGVFCHIFHRSGKLLVTFLRVLVGLD